MRTRRLLLICLPACWLAACTIGPDYRRPETNLPAKWLAERPGVSASAASPGSPATPWSENPLDSAWWASFQDPELDALVQSTLEGNKDLRIASYRIEQFDAYLQVSQSTGLPQVGYNASRTRDSLSENRQVPLVVGAQPVDNSYIASAGATWELDLWGKVRRSNEAALADLLSSEENRRALASSLVAEVATGYVRLLGLDSELELLQQTLSSRRETLRLLEAKLAGGGSSALPVARAQAELLQAEADIPAKEAEIAELENALSGLIGRDPGPIRRGKTAATLALPVVPGGLPADLLVQRPDVRKAEQDLVAANARIGVARAQYLPTIALTGSSGFASADLSNLALLSSNFGSFGVTLLGPIFTSGRISGQVREAEAVQKQTATIFLRSVQTALREVEGALVANRKAGQQAAMRGLQVRALQELRDQSLKRHLGGYTGYLEVLEADRGLYAGQFQQGQARREQFASLIAVYKAMGGGWSLPEVTAPRPNPPKTNREPTKHE